jgi:hypothetical protein
VSWNVSTVKNSKGINIKNIIRQVRVPIIVLVYALGNSGQRR